MNMMNTIPSSAHCFQWVQGGQNVLTSQEAIQLYEQLEVDIVTLGRLSVRAPNVMSVEIDTYSENPIVSL